MKKQPKLTLVGAGPGDPDLITLKGVKALNQADVVLYDALVNEALLQNAPEATLLFVGKRLGCHAYTQDEINQLIVDNALRYGHVVRLKGGDPFVFGRGTEELDYAESFGLEVQIVSGVTSSISVPASLGVSLTKRKVANSFCVVTGTTTDRTLSADLYAFAKTSATVVVLMGMSKLEQIVAIFKGENKGDLPVAIIQNGTTEQEKIGIGTIDTISAVVAEEGLSSPAIIVIGEVVKESQKLRYFYEELTIDNEVFYDRFIN
jgi:uroporphyrin-III C-methyltransferase